jgi:hypothetical protein
MNIGDLRPVPHGYRTQVEVIIARGSPGTIRVIKGPGGRLIRAQSTIKYYGHGMNKFQVARLNGAKALDRDHEELPILDDDTTATYNALYCGETFFIVWVSMPQIHVEKSSELMRLLSLVDKAETVSPPPGDYSPHPDFKSGLVSKEGTPLNPKPGRKINIFGEGESAGFEDYSSDIDYCSHSWSNGNGPPGVPIGHRPWTADPRKPPGIPDKSVSNICCRGSPLKPWTLEEISRIAASQCRITYAEARGRDGCDALRAALKSAKVIDEGTWGQSGRAIVLELP